MLERLNGIEDEAERERYKELLAGWHTSNQNKERRHDRKQDSRALDGAENPAASGKETGEPPLGSRLYRHVEFEDILFSDNPDDLHELVTHGALSRIIKGDSS